MTLCVPLAGALENDPVSQARRALEQGDALYGQGRVELACQHYELAVVVAPEWWYPAYKKALCDMSRGQLRDAWYLLSRAREAKGGMYVVRLALARYHRQAGRPEEAIPQYEAAIAAAAGAVEPMVELSDVLVSLERPGEAHLVLKRAEYFAPTNLTVRSRLARLSEKLGHLADAEEHLRYLASNGTNVRRNLTLLARFYARRGAPKESQAVLSVLQRDMRGGWTLPPAVGQFPGEALPGDPDPGQPGSSDG